MAALNYAESLRRVLADEGGYSNDDGDPGGPTKYGITIIDYRKYVKPDATATDVRNMTVDEAKRIYAQRYWMPIHGDSQPTGVDYATFDYGVNSGVSRADKVLRRLCDLPDSANWSDVLAAVAKRDPKAVSDAMWDERLRFLQSLSTWSRFGGGWGSRVRCGKVASRAMVDGAVTTGGTEVRSGGKAEHPAPVTVKKIVKGAGGAGAIGAGSFAHWIGAHPFVTLCAVLAAVAGTAWVVSRVHAAWVTKQTTPMPGTKPVPELPTLPHPEEVAAK